MNHTRHEHRLLTGFRFATISLVILAIGELATTTGCGADSGDETVSPTRRGGRNVEVTQVAVRHCTWDPLGRTGEDPALSLVKALISGDVAGVDAILSRGKIGINDVICLTENDNVRRGKLRTDQTQFRPPEIARNVGAMFAKHLYAYTVTAKYDSALGENDVIEFYGTPLMVAARAGNPQMVAFLLKEGANPNVFIRTRGVDSQMEGRLVGGPITVSGRRPWAVLSALTECYVRTVGKYVENEDGCATLLIGGGAAMPPENGQGQTALWAAAQARSRLLLEYYLKAGADVNHKDALGMTVADYVSQEIASVPPGSLRQEFEAFLGELTAHGASQSGGQTSPPPSAEAPTWQTPGIPQRAPEQSTAVDHSAEIEAIELQLVELRAQLTAARHDAEMNAITGVASLSAQMRVMELINAIHERERRLSALQNY